MKRIIAVVLVLSLCLAATSCDIVDSIFGVKYSENQVAFADEKMSVNYYSPRPDGYKEFTDKLDSFAAKLTAEVYKDSNKQTNVCISPVSVYMALALATECSNGETREELLNAVGVTYDEVKNFTKYLYALSNREFYYRNPAGQRKTSAFEELANSIWAEESIKLKEQGVDNLATNFNCDLFLVNFKNGEGEKAINAYIKDKTHGMIDGGVELSDRTLITLINTFYLKEIWNMFGNNLPYAEGTYQFTNAGGNVIETKLLRGYYSDGKVYEGKGYSSFYTETYHGFKIKFIVPSEGRSLDEVFTAENLYEINNIANYGKVDDANKILHYTRVFFPEYNASYDGDLMGILKNDFGINRMFDFDKCDFSNITDEQIACESVIHKCELKVDKKGIEGAAVTVVVGNGAAGPDEYEKVYHDFVIDRAFGYIITDGDGVVLFSGVVNGI